MPLPACMARPLLVPLLVLLTGCAGTPEASPPVPPDFALSLSQGGGVTGQWSGLSVDATGAVTAWEGIGEDRTATAADTLSADALAALWSRVDPASFETDVDAPGNLTARIEATSSGRTHHAVWAPGTRLDLDALYTDLRARLGAAR